MNQSLLANLDEGSGLTPASKVVRQTQCQPPVSFIVVRETPPRPGKMPYSERASSVASCGRSIPFNSSPSLSSAFRLQPRGGKPIATPSPSSRGRKRSAQCLTTTPPISVVSRNNMPSPDTPRTAESPDSSERAYSANWESPIPCATNTKDSPGTARMDYSPTRVESALQTLSIKSPRIARRPDCSSNSPLSVSGAARPGSSFILYTSSPLGTSYGRPQGDGTGIGGSASAFINSPCSISSPRLAPLTVLQKSNHKEAATPTKRPPLHCHPSNLIISLDSKQNAATDDTVHRPEQTPRILPRRDDGMNTLTPTKIPTSKFGTPEQSPTLFCATPKRIFAGSPCAKGSHRTPITITSSSRRSSPRTPLPRVKLTPKTSSSRRSSPRTPLPRVKLTPKSQSRRERADRSLDLMSNDFIFSRSSRPQLFFDDRKMEDKSKTFGKASDASLGESKKMLPSSPPPRKRSYLPIPDWCDIDVVRPARGQVMLPTLRSPSLPGSNQLTPNDTTMVDKCDLPVIETKSLLTPSKSGSMLAQMMEADERRASLDTDGSLTDPDDDDMSFVLTNPAFLVEGRQFQGRARQRQRLSYNSLDQSVVRQSSTSLALSTQASNTSLLGMAFIQQSDSSASLIPREMTPPVSSLPMDTKKRDHFILENVNEFVDDKSNNLSRLKAEDSLSSVGLALEESALDNKQEEGRDLMTPPAVETNRYSSPPPLPAVETNRYSSPPTLSVGNDTAKTTPVNSVFISRADPQAVNLTIARMAFHANQCLSPGMECV